MKNITSPYILRIIHLFCEDNYLDVVESKNKRFYIGVRFHPESLYKKDNRIFEEFINACKD